MQSSNNLLGKLKEHWRKEESHPLILGLVTGVYPFLFYVSNNFYATNSWGHWGIFLLVFLGIPIVAFTLLFISFKYIPLFKKYKYHLLFIAIVFLTLSFLSFASTLQIKKKLMLGILLGSAVLSIPLHKKYKKLLPLILVVSVLPFFKLSYKAWDHFAQRGWVQQPDDIENIKFVKTPNVYFIQPDGYVAQHTMESDNYGYKSPLYDELKEGGYTVYEDFRSNYPSSLNSNASLLTMKQHAFTSSFFPSPEMPYAREIIVSDNPVVSIFKNNGYTTHLMTETEYFQQNKKQPVFDRFNISPNEIPYFSRGTLIERDVLADLRTAFQEKDDNPQFFFIEKLLPHHIGFHAKEDRVNTERREYLDDVKEANLWINEILSFIKENDPNAIVIVLADHGGWVGIDSDLEMITTQDPVHVESIYSALAAIKWNGNLPQGFDNELKTNVNVFRVLFAALGNDAALLEHLEDNSSYNLFYKNSFFKGVSKLINDEGEFVFEKM